MRAKRVRALCGSGDSLLNTDKSLRRAVKKAYMQGRRAKASASVAPAKRRRKPTKVVFRGVGKPKRTWEPCGPVLVRPITHIGKFYGMLSAVNKERALDLAKVAGRIDRIHLIHEVQRLEASNG